jgi:hypothetical protein
MQSGHADFDEERFMKKVILAAMAVGALAVGGVARADVIDNVGNAISQLFGVPYDPNPSGAVPGDIFTGRDGHKYQVDASGRSVQIDQFGSYRDAWGRTVYLGANGQPLYVEQNGAIVPYGGRAYASGTPYDRDGDGVTNPYDRYPDDARYR